MSRFYKTRGAALWSFRPMSRLALVLVFSLLPGCATLHPKDPPMTLHATGAFAVKTTPLPPDPTRPSAFPRLAIDKTFTGDLVGTGAGEMTAFQGEAGSAYVALDRITGALGGKQGSFLLTHVGTMRPGAMTLEVKVVPGTGTGALTGLEGTLTIRIEGGQHFYSLDYTLP